MFDTLIHRWLKVPYTLHIHANTSVKNPQATLLFIHGIGSSAREWDEVVKNLPDDVAVLTIDLLGFGDSSRPHWASYNAHTQAISVMATLVKLRLIHRKFIIVGHSLGSLVAIELARKYPRIVDSLILCAPPLYRKDQTQRKIPRLDTLLKKLYASIENRPDDFITYSQLAVKYNLLNKAFAVTKDNIAIYIATLKAAIINQTAYEDALHIQKPTTIIYGSLDPFVIEKNIKFVAKNNAHIRLRRLVAGHEITRRYSKVLLDEINCTIDKVF